MANKTLKWNDTSKRALINIYYDPHYAIDHPFLSIIAMLRLLAPKQKINAVITNVREVSLEDLEETKARYICRGAKGLRPVYLYKVAFVYNDILYSISDIPSYQLAMVQDAVTLKVSLREPTNYTMAFNKK